MTNGPIGSPITLPLTSLLITFASVLASALVFAPATLLASRVRVTRPLWIQGPLEFFVAGIAALLICVLWRLGSGSESWQAQLASGGWTWVFLAPGFALYWFAARSAEGVLSVAARAFAWIRRRLAPTA